MRIRLSRRRLFISAALAVALLPLLPVAQANEEPIRCDDTPAEVVIGVVERLQPFLTHVATRTGEVAGKTRCLAYQTVGLCGDESWPPTLTPATRTNPSNRHGYVSPCYEIFAPGFEYQFGCSTLHAMRHTWTPGGNHVHQCVPLQRVFAPV